MTKKPNSDPLQFATEQDRLALYDDRPATLKRRGRIILGGAGILATATIGIGGGQAIVNALRNNPKAGPSHQIMPGFEQPDIGNTDPNVHVAEKPSDTADESGIVVPRERQGGRYGNETFSYNPDEVPTGYAEKLKEVYPDRNP